MPPPPNPKSPHLDPPPTDPPDRPPTPHRPSLNPPLQCPPPRGLWPTSTGGGGGVASKSEGTAPPWRPPTIVEPGDNV